MEDVLDEICVATDGRETVICEAINEVRKFLNINGGNNPKEISYYDGQIFISNDGLIGMQYFVGNVSVILDPDMRLKRSMSIQGILNKYVNSGLNWYRLV